LVPFLRIPGVPNLLFGVPSESDLLESFSDGIGVTCHLVPLSTAGFWNLATGRFLLTPDEPNDLLFDLGSSPLDIDDGSAVLIDQFREGRVPLVDRLENEPANAAGKVGNHPKFMSIETDCIRI
jgi:hypothetical protein